MLDTRKRQTVGLLLIAAMFISTLSIGRFLLPARAQDAGCEWEGSWGIFRVRWTREVVDLTNQHRVGMGLEELSVSRALTRSALWKSSHMAEYEYLDHDDPAPPVDRGWDERVEDCGYFGGSGENIAYGYRSPAAVLRGWLDSPGHRANIERDSYETFGIGVATSRDGTTYWTQNFGTEDTSSDDDHSPPEPQADGVETAEDDVISFQPLANDLDPDSDPLEITETTEPVHGEVRVSIDGEATYLPERDFFGDDSFTYTVWDVFGLSWTATVSIAVAPVNDRPAVRGESRKVRAGRTVRIQVLTNDSDVDGDILRLDGIVKQPRRGEVVDIDKRDGTITYRSLGDASGRRDRIVYRVTDGNGGSGRATLRLKIRR